MGEKVLPYHDYQVGKMFIRYSMDMLGDIQEFEQLSIFGEIEQSQLH